MTAADERFIDQLEKVVNERLRNPTENSYTSSLGRAGTKRIAQKLGEEGVELALAAISGDENEIIDEAADLIYHLLVLLANSGLSLSDVEARLKSRHK